MCSTSPLRWPLTLATPGPKNTTAEFISAANRSPPPDESPRRESKPLPRCIRRRGSGGSSSSVRRVRFPQLVSAPSDLAAVRHCFDCSCYFPEVFQNCAPVSTNGATNTSAALACQTRRGKASSVTGAGPLHPSSQRLKQTRRYQ